MEIATSEKQKKNFFLKWEQFKGSLESPLAY